MGAAGLGEGAGGDAAHLGVRGGHEGAHGLVDAGRVGAEGRPRVAQAEADAAAAHGRDPAGHPLGLGGGGVRARWRRSCRTW